MASHVFDLAELIEQLDLAPVTSVGHSLGGNIATRYAGLYPENVARLVAIEGLGPSPERIAERESKPVGQRMRDWIEGQRALALRRPRRYGTFDEALARMLQENAHFTPDQARHLAEHGVRRDADGRYSWKFDNYARSNFPFDFTAAELHALWSRIDCPTLLVYGADSWASNPAMDGRLAHFRAAHVALIEHAGHWVHHDQLERFLRAVEEFLVA
jgi:pimeloyl-ACP methyl ester carboxylesterase